MTSRDFVIWLKGFSEACHEFHPTPKQWDRLKEVLNEVEDYNDYGDIDEEAENWYPEPSSISRPDAMTVHSGPLTGDVLCNSLTISSSSSSSAYSNTIWNDKMGNWHYTNYPDGFGYYHNNENKKQQLND
jgi:hypothetical protein